MNINVNICQLLFASSRRSIQLAAARINGPMIPLIIVLSLWAGANVLHHYFGHRQIMSQYEARLALARDQSPRRSLRFNTKRLYLANEERYCSRSGYALVGVSLLIVAASWAGRGLKKRAAGGDRGLDIRDFATTALARVRAGRKFIVAGGGLFICFFAFYLTMSRGLAATPASLENNILFENDTPRVIDDISNP